MCEKQCFDITGKSFRTNVVRKISNKTKYQQFLGSWCMLKLQLRVKTGQSCLINLTYNHTTKTGIFVSRPVVIHLAVASTAPLWWQMYDFETYGLWVWLDSQSLTVHACLYFLSLMLWRPDPRDHWVREGGSVWRPTGRLLHRPGLRSRLQGLPRAQVWVC